MGLIKFLHVMAGVSFLGLIIANFFYVSYSYTQKEPMLFKYALKMALISDLFILPILLFMFASAHYMVQAHQLSLATPWIKMAYMALGVVSLAWLSNVGIKWVNLQQLKYKPEQVVFRLRYLFFILNAMLILLFMIIIHDAVMQRTFTWFH